MVKVDVEGFNVDWREVELDLEIEEFKAHHEPGVEVGVKLNVGIELERVNFRLRKLNLAESPVPCALDVPCESGFPVSDEGGPRDGFFAWVDAVV